MSKPIWFRLRPDRLGWTPCAWQGWIAIGIFVAALAAGTAAWGASSPGRLIVAGLFLVALLVSTAALTSGTTKTGN